MANREAIINSLPEKELFSNNPEFHALINKKSDLNDNDIKDLETLASKIEPDTIFANLKVSTLDDNIKNHLYDLSIESKLETIVKANKGLRKHQIIELLLKDSLLNKEGILNFMKRTYNENFEWIKSKLTKKQSIKFEDALLKEDLKDLESLNENRTVETIKAVNLINKSHNNFLNEMKSKTTKIEAIIPKKELENVGSTSQIDDTMELFD